jgi:CubicO group peptidase (beta-lactamase class C family)
MLKKLTVGALACAWLAVAAAAYSATTEVSQPQATGTTSPAAQLTAADINVWLDGLLPYALENTDVAGASVAVIKDGEILTARGFGYADTATRTPVDPVKTLFRPGSVSKLFTWTAVMQLVEQGKLDLDADINRYLDFRIAPRGDRPITLRNLMQHTGGFEEVGKGVISASPVPGGFEKLLKQWVPARVYTAGSTPAYSNYATSLAGYIVQRVSGEPYDQYIEQHIFVPLDMTHSTTRQPLPGQFAADVSKCYLRGSGPAQPFEIVGPGPAGALSSSAQDMAHFMIAHLQDGEYRGQRILQPATAQLMHNSPLNDVPPLNSMELGFFQTSVNGRDIIGHLGDTECFHTALHLFMKENVGLYVSFNSAGNLGDHLLALRSAVLNGFADRYFPDFRVKGRVDASAAVLHAAMMDGTWAASRRSDSTFLSSFFVLSQLHLGDDGKGRLIWDFLGKPRHWVETAPFVWDDMGSHDRMAAKIVDGVAVRFSTDLTPFEVFDRVPWYENSSWLLPALSCAAVVLLLTAIGWPVAALTRRRYGVVAPVLPTYRWSRLGAVLILAALILWGCVVVFLTADSNNATARTDWLLYTTQVFGILAIVAGLAAILWNARKVWAAPHRWSDRLWDALLALAALLIFYYALLGHLLTVTANY